MFPSHSHPSGRNRKNQMKSHIFLIITTKFQLQIHYTLAVITGNVLGVKVDQLRVKIHIVKMCILVDEGEWFLRKNTDATLIKSSQPSALTPADDEEWSLQKIRRGHKMLGAIMCWWWMFVYGATSVFPLIIDRPWVRVDKRLYIFYIFNWTIKTETIKFIK